VEPIEIAPGPKRLKSFILIGDNKMEPTDAPICELPRWGDKVINSGYKPTTDDTPWQLGLFWLGVGLVIGIVIGVLAVL
jgi:hypothetical protein